jgi:hypothetical protein
VESRAWLSGTASEGRILPHLGAVRDKDCWLGLACRAVPGGLVSLWRMGPCILAWLYKTGF